MPLRHISPAHTIVNNRQTQHPARHINRHHNRRRTRMLIHIHQTLRHHIISRRRHMIRNSRNPRMNRHRNHRPSSRLLNSGHQPPIHQHRRRNPPRQLTQLRQRVPRLNHRLIQNRLRPDRITARLTPSPSQIHIQPHQPLLRPIMQIPLQPPQRRTLRPTTRLTRPRQPLNIRPIPSTPQQQHISDVELDIACGVHKIGAKYQRKQPHTEAEASIEEVRVGNIQRFPDASVAVIDITYSNNPKRKRLCETDGRHEDPDKRNAPVRDCNGKRHEYP